VRHLISGGRSSCYLIWKINVKISFSSLINPERAKIALTVGERIDKVERDPYIVGADAISTTKE
jgi:hypothetical protein